MCQSTGYIWCIGSLSPRLQVPSSVIKHFSVFDQLIGWPGEASAALASAGSLSAVYDCCSPKIWHKYTPDSPRDTRIDVLLPRGAVGGGHCSQRKRANPTQTFLSCGSIGMLFPVSYGRGDLLSSSQCLWNGYRISFLLFFGCFPYCLSLWKTTHVHRIQCSFIHPLKMWYLTFH